MLWIDYTANSYTEILQYLTTSRPDEEKELVRVSMKSYTAIHVPKSVKRYELKLNERSLED